MSTYSKEGTKLKGKLTEQIGKEGLLEDSQSKNALKKVRRTLGAVLFSPDNQGYLDVVENGLASGDSAEQIMKKLRRMSEKYVESFSPIPGITEAHHIIPLNSLRDKVLELSLEDQIELFNRLDKAGWKLGDSPTQLMNTVLTRMSHQGQRPRLSGNNVEIKKLFSEVALPNKELTAHPRGTYDRLVQVQGGTVDEIWNDFTTRVAPLAQKDVAKALLVDLDARKAAEALGLDLFEVLPEDLAKQLNDPPQARQVTTGVAAMADPEVYTGQPSKSAANVIVSSEALQDPGFVGELVTSLRGVDDAGIKHAQRQLTKLASRTLKAGATLGIAGGLIGVGDRGVQAKEAEEVGDQAGVAKAGAQLGGEIAAAAFPVADVVNIGTDVASTYGELREAGVTHKQMGQAALNLAGKAIQNPGKAVGFVREAVADIPERTMEGFNFLANKYRQANMSLSGYSLF